MAKGKPFNLFVYGTLMNPSVFRAVLGRILVPRRADADGRETFYPRRAILNGYKKISPDRTYLYAVPARHGRIRGRLIGPLPAECLSPLRKYEGRNYHRKRVRVQTRKGTEEAVAFVGNIEQLEHSFGYEFRDHLKQEFLLTRKIEAALAETEREQLHTSEDLARRAVGELHGPTIRDLVRRHFRSGGISDYAIRQSLKDTPLPDFSRIADDSEAKALAPNYLAMVIRQVIFNQFEDRVHRDFRFELDQLPHSADCYERSVSSLIALRMLNASGTPLDVIVGDCLTDLDFPAHELVDFVRWSIVAADAAYDAALARKHLRFVRNHMGQGFIPLGVELEFSDIGHEVIRDPKGEALRGLRYDGFLFFRDFALDALTWKLGGHIDDHHEKVSQQPRRGFFEVALGSLSIEADLSKPIARDPWLLNQVIHEVRRFYRIAPHSLHVSMQLRSRHKPMQDRLLPLGVMKCLFAIAGDPARDERNRRRISRLVSGEIVSRKHHSMLFSEIRKRFSREDDESYPSLRTPDEEGRYVQQFRFLRLSPRLNYELIVLALKGIQIRLRPGSFLTARQYAQSRRHRSLFGQILAWGEDPTPLADKEIEAFLRYVREGLVSERRGKPAHSEAYIAWAIHQLHEKLEKFNRRTTVRLPAVAAKRPPAP